MVSRSCFQIKTNGISDNLLNISENFESDRKIRAIYDSQTSDW